MFGRSRSGGYAGLRATDAENSRYRFCQQAVAARFQECEIVEGKQRDVRKVGIGRERETTTRRGQPVDHTNNVSAGEGIAHRDRYIKGSAGCASLAHQDKTASEITRLAVKARRQ